MNIKLQHYLYHSILGFFMVVGSSSTFAAAEVYHETYIDGECIDYPYEDTPHTYCWEYKGIWTSVETPSGNVIYHFKGDYTESYSHLGETTAYFEIVDNRRLHTVKKAGGFEDHVYLNSTTSEFCNSGLRVITTSDYRFVNGQVVRENTIYEQLPC